MIDIRRLAHQVETRLGTYLPGLDVEVLKITSVNSVVICLDPDSNHPSGRCHRATVPTHWLTRAPMWRPNTREAAA